MKTYRNTATGMALGLAMIMITAGCSQTVLFPASDMAPAAEASAKIGKDDNDNTIIDLRVNHLAKPAKLTPPALTYVVWAQTEDGRFENLGALNVDKKLSGRFQSTTPLKKFRLIVTAEDLPTTVAPSDRVVLKTAFLTR